MDEDFFKGVIVGMASLLLLLLLVSVFYEEGFTEKQLLQLQATCDVKIK